MGHDIETGFIYFDATPDIFYLPRLMEVAMEMFCKGNIKFYQYYFAANIEQVLRSDIDTRIYTGLHSHK